MDVSKVYTGWLILPHVQHLKFKTFELPRTKSILQRHFRAEWTGQNNDYPALHDPLQQLQRSQQVVIFRIGTGHWPESLLVHEVNWSLWNSFVRVCTSRSSTKPHLAVVFDACSTVPAWTVSKDLATKLWDPVAKLCLTNSFMASTCLRLSLYGRWM